MRLVFDYDWFDLYDFVILYMVTVSVSGIEEVKRALARFSSDMQDRVIDKGLDYAAAEVAKIERSEAPKSSKVHYQYYGGKKVTINPGNLQKSIARIAGIKGSKSKKVRVVGPRAGKRSKYDGWYGRFVAKGTRHSRANAYHERAAERAKGLVRDIIVDSVAKAINKIR